MRPGASAVHVHKIIMHTNIMHIRGQVHGENDRRHWMQHRLYYKYRLCIKYLRCSALPLQTQQAYSRAWPQALRSLTDDARCVHACDDGRCIGVEASILQGKRCGVPPIAPAQ